jgi:hypothetical protein
MVTARIFVQFLHSKGRKEDCDCLRTVLGTVFEPKGQETGGWGKFNHVKLRNAFKMLLG